MYHHPEVKKVMMETLNYSKNSLESILDIIDTIFKILEDVKNIIQVKAWQLNLQKREEIAEFYAFPMSGPDTVALSKNMNQIYYLMDLINSTSKYISSVTVDVYFLRRFLDKDYITNGLVYAGAFHTMMHIYILVKYFDFKVTSGSYLKYDVQKINSSIKQATMPSKIGELFLPAELYQCSNISFIPEKEAESLSEAFITPIHEFT